MITIINEPSVSHLSKAFALGFAIVLVTSTAAVAQDTNVPTKLKPVIVTGSLIPTAETVGPAPVNIVGAVDIQRSGQQDVLATLTKLDPAFSGSGNIGQVANNFSIGGALPAGEANVALRNLPTLVLLDGRRLPNSALSGGQLIDVNTIPLSIISRVEVLKDGASALYGSDAVGGVINIITRRDWNGTEISGRVGFPTRPDSNRMLEYRGSLITGATATNYMYFVGGQYYHMDPLLTKDRSVAALGIAALVRKGIAPPSYFSPSYAGRVEDDNGAYILAGSPFARGGPGYNPGLVTPPVYAGQAFSGGSAVGDYNTYAIAHGYTDPTGNGLGPYVPLGMTPLGAQLDALDPDGNLGLNGFYPFLDTTAFGTHTIQSQDRRNVFANFDHDLFGKKLQFFGSFLYANDQSRGVLAPSPMVSLNLYNIAVSSNNVYNPFGIDLGGNGGAGTPRIRSRFVDTGNRIFDAQSDTYHIVAGLKGEITPDYDWEAAYDYNRASQTYFTRNAINGAGLNQSLAGQLTDANFNLLPEYNIFALDGFNRTNGPQTLDTLKATLYNSGVSELWSADGRVHGTPYELPAGPLDFVVGSSYTFESLSLSVDGLTQLGLVPGLNQAFPFSGGKRDRAAVFAEMRIPIFSEQKNIPGFYGLEVTAAGRYERIWPGGDAGVPHIGVRWQPLDKQFTIRGGYSQGFLAPSIYNLFGPDFVSNPVLSLPGGSGQVQTQTRSNPGLPPANSENWNVGLVYSPKQIPGLTVSIDYYNIQQSHVVIADYASIARNLNALGSASPFAGGFTFFDGSTLTTTDPDQVNAGNWGNLILTNTAAAALRTEGLDLSATYERPTENLGKITLLGNANMIFNYEVRSSPSSPYHHYEGQWTANFGTSQGVIPDYRINCGLVWEYQDFAYTILAHYIPSVTDLGFLHPEVGAEFQGFTLNNQPWKVSDYYTIDMQLAYNFGEKWGRFLKGTRLSVGANNVTDVDPPLIASAIEDNTDKGTYDILGRFVYFEISKSF
jgi:iron complex outermembrane recepter protein